MVDTVGRDRDVKVFVIFLQDVKETHIWRKFYKIHESMQKSGSFGHLKKYIFLSNCLLYTGKIYVEYLNIVKEETKKFSEC